MIKKRLDKLINFLAMWLVAYSVLFNIGYYINKISFINNLNIPDRFLSFIFSVFIIGGIFLGIKILINKFYFKEY